MCFGPLKRLCYWGPLIALGILKLVTYMTVHCSRMLFPKSSFGGFLNLLVFLLLSGVTLYAFLNTVFEGPGFLPLKWLPESAKDETYLQFCKICLGFKAPRSHHCRKCGRCVLKMDHHCPWINTCVGHANHAHFTAFLFFSIVASTHAAFVLSFSLYSAIYRIWYIHNGEAYQVQFSVVSLIFCVFALGLSIGVIVALSMLLFLQMRSILRNRTGIEDWILEKAIFRRRAGNMKPFIYPYDLGRWNNLKQVFNFGFGASLDGITWPVAPGCTQFTLTIEQKEQKEEKRSRTRPYTVVKKYRGSWFPISYGYAVLLSIPCSDEPRIPLEVSETIYVTRWKRDWLFGGKALEEDEAVGMKGWFPRCCVTEIEPEKETKKNR